MIPSNFIPSGPQKQQKFSHYTDDTPSREIEETTNINSLLQFREKLLKIAELIKELEEEIAQL